MRSRDKKPTLAERLTYCDAVVTLDGKPAKVMGAFNKFARVGDLEGGGTVEYSWSVVRTIVTHYGGKFTSGFA